MSKYPKKYMSYSQIDQYLRCPFCFRVKYIDGAEQEDTKFLSFGRIIHDVFENYTGNESMMREVFKERLISESHLYEDKEEAMKFYQKGTDAITHYTASDLYHLEAVGREVRFNAKLLPNTPSIIGFIDFIYGNPDMPSTWNIVDYKTSASTKPKEALRTDLQMPIYALAMHKKYGVFPNSIEYFYPVINKRQRAIHLGDGIYQYQNQREPVVHFNAFDALPIIQQVHDDVVAGKFDERAMHFFCTSDCKSAGGWGAVPKYGDFK